MTNDVEHVVEVVTDGDRHRAECWCGWASEWSGYDDEAEWAGEDHRQVVVGPPDEFNRLMGDLLDLQDDIAQVVVWLAENWSADLPAPRWYGGDMGHGVLAVLVYCPESVQLDRAAELLDVELVDDAEPTPAGSRYRRAERCFGRVRVEASRRITATCAECGTDFDGIECPECAQRADAGRCLRMATEQATAEAGLP